MQRKLKLSQNKMIAGVCGGYAEYFNIDVSILRILWLIAVLFAGIGAIAYIVSWIIMPAE